MVRGNNRMVPLSVEAEEFSLKIVLTIRVPTGEGSDGSKNGVPSREIPEGVVGRSKAVVSTTAVAGAVAPVVFAGADVPAVAGSKFPAVAEAYSSAVDAEGVPLVIQIGGRGALLFERVLCGSVGKLET